MCKLTQNMQLSTSEGAAHYDTQNAWFAEWLLLIGDGAVGIPEVNQLQDVKRIHIPAQFLIPWSDCSLLELIKFVYDKSLLSNPTAKSFAERAVICPKNRWWHFSTEIYK